MYVLTSVHADPAQARRIAAEHIALYLRDIPGYYSRVAEKASFEEEIAQAQKAPSLSAAADALPDALIDLLAVAGTPEQVRAGLNDIREAVSTSPLSVRRWMPPWRTTSDSSGRVSPSNWWQRQYFVSVP